MALAADATVDDCEAWRKLAACRGRGTDLFFPVGQTGDAIDQASRAKRICQCCAVQRECLEFALATEQEHGVWGGTTEAERRSILKRWRARRRRAAG